MRCPHHSLSHSGKSATIRESNHGSGVCKEHYVLYYAPNGFILLAWTAYGKLVLCHASSAFLKSITMTIRKS